MGLFPSRSMCVGGEGHWPSSEATAALASSAEIRQWCFKKHRWPRNPIISFPTQVTHPRPHHIRTGVECAFQEALDIEKEPQNLWPLSHFVFSITLPCKRELCKAHDRLADVRHKSLDPKQTLTPAAQWSRSHRIPDEKECVSAFVATLVGWGRKVCADVCGRWARVVSGWGLDGVAMCVCVCVR